MYILKELIADNSFLRNMFIYISEIINPKTYRVCYNKIKHYHIIIIDHTFFGLKRSPRNKYKWQKIRQSTARLLNNVKNRTCFIIGDCHNYTFAGGIRSVVVVCNKYNIDYLVSFYDKNNEINNLKCILAKSKSKTIFIPMTNAINNNVFKNHNLSKIYDIILYGRINDNYPLRKRICNLLKSKKFGDHFKIKIIEYGEYEEINLSIILNQSYLCVATKSKYDYLVKKYFEISASKSLILENMPVQGNNIFSYVHISNNMNDNKIFKIIKSTLSNKIKIIKQSQINHNIVCKQYTINNFHQSLYFKLFKYMRRTKMLE